MHFYPVFPSVGVNDVKLVCRVLVDSLREGVIHLCFDPKGAKVYIPAQASERVTFFFSRHTPLRVSGTGLVGLKFLRFEVSYFLKFDYNHRM